jgi:hypothetical protein
MRRPRLFAVVGAVVVVSVLAALGSAAPVGSVASGRFGAVPWTLSATDSPDGKVCLTMTLPRHFGGTGGGCGSIFGPGAGRSQGITYLAHTGNPSPDYIVGPVVAMAKTVLIALSDGKVIRATTIAPRKGLTSKIAFYVAELPCPARPTSVRGVDTAGRTIARLTIHQFRPLGKPPLAKTTC